MESNIVNHVDVVHFEAVPVPKGDGLVRKYPRHLKAKELKLLEVKDDYLPTFLKWARPSARLSERRTISERGRS